MIRNKVVTVIRKMYAAIAILSFTIYVAVWSLSDLIAWRVQESHTVLGYSFLCSANGNLQTVTVGEMVDGVPWINGSVQVSDITKYKIGQKVSYKAWHFPIGNRTAEGTLINDSHDTPPSSTPPDGKRWSFILRHLPEVRIGDSKETVLAILGNPNDPDFCPAGTIQYIVFSTERPNGADGKYIRMKFDASDKLIAIERVDTMFGPPPASG